MKKDSNYNHLCKRCGRKLRTEKAKRMGMGQVCYRKWLRKNTHKKLIKTGEQDEINAITSTND